METMPKPYTPLVVPKSEGILKIEPNIFLMRSSLQKGIDHMFRLVDPTSGVYLNVYLEERNGKRNVRNAKVGSRPDKDAPKDLVGTGKILESYLEPLVEKLHNDEFGPYFEADVHLKRIERLSNLAGLRLPGAEQLVLFEISEIPNVIEVHQHNVWSAAFEANAQKIWTYSRTNETPWQNVENVVVLDNGQRLLDETIQHDLHQQVLGVLDVYYTDMKWRQNEIMDEIQVLKPLLAKIDKIGTMPMGKMSERELDKMLQVSETSTQMDMGGRGR